MIALYVDGEESGSIGPPLLNLADPREAGHERRSRARPEVDNQRHWGQQTQAQPQFVADQTLLLII